MNQLLLISNNDAKELLKQPKDFILLQSRDKLNLLHKGITFLKRSLKNYCITRSIYVTFSNKAIESKMFQKVIEFYNSQTIQVMHLELNNLEKRNECFLRGITLDSNIPSYETRRCIT